MKGKIFYILFALGVLLVILGFYMSRNLENFTVPPVITRIISASYGTASDCTTPLAANPRLTELFFNTIDGQNMQFKDISFNWKTTTPSLGEDPSPNCPQKIMSIRYKCSDAPDTIKVATGSGADTSNPNGPTLRLTLDCRTSTGSGTGTGTGTGSGSGSGNKNPLHDPNCKAGKYSLVTSGPCSGTLDTPGYLIATSGRAWNRNGWNENKTGSWGDSINRWNTYNDKTYDMYNYDDYDDDGGLITGNIPSIIDTIEDKLSGNVPKLIDGIDGKKIVGSVISFTSKELSALKNVVSNAGTKLKSDVSSIANDIKLPNEFSWPQKLSGANDKYVNCKKVT